MAFIFTYAGDTAKVHVKSLLPRLVSKQGMTILNHIFIAGGQTKVSAYLLAHEFGHVVQWRRLGPLGFVKAYVGGLLKHGYENHPMEHEAHLYGVQHMGALNETARVIRGGV